MLLGEVLTLWHAHQLAGGVVHPAVVGAAEPARTAALPVGDEGGAAVLADVVECGQRAIGLTGDHHRLTVRFEAGPVTGVGHIGATRGDQPAGPEHPLALEFEANGVGVRVA